MTHQIRMTLNELDVSVSALEILSPDEPEAADLADEFLADLREKVGELEGLNRESRHDPELHGGVIDDVLVLADEDRWIALADGLDVLDPDEEEAADIAAALSSRLRDIVRSASPSV